MKKIIIIVSVIVISIMGYFLYQYIRIKTANIEIVLVDDLEVEFLSDVSVSSFIESINGSIIDDYKIDTKTIGDKVIDFEFINEDNIKLKYSYNIKVVDSVAPVIWLGKSYNVVVGSDIDLLDKILCGDNYDSSPDCSIEGSYNLNMVGSYDLVFKAVDSSNNETIKEFTLNVNESTTNSSGSGVTYFSDVVKNYKTDNVEIGIDVSRWQGDIDFDKLKSENVEFIIIRIGGSTGIDKENFIDSKFRENIEGATQAGIKVGLYFYSYANTLKRAREDALWVIENIKDYDVELGVSFDWENWNSFNDFNLSFYELTNIAEEFMDTISDAGYPAMLYSSKTYLENIWLDYDYPTWLAHYTTNTDYTSDYSYWQMCSNGKVEGIETYVDIDIRYLN